LFHNNKQLSKVVGSKEMNRARGVAHVVECLPSECKALSPNSSTAKKKKDVLTHTIKQKFIVDTFFEFILLTVIFSFLGSEIFV
jgi:hypothetical protein